MISDKDSYRLDISEAVAVDNVDEDGKLRAEPEKQTSAITLNSKKIQ